MTSRRAYVNAAAFLAISLFTGCSTDLAAPALRHTSAPASLSLGSWMRRAPMPMAFNTTALASVAGRIHAFGGQLSADCTYTTAVQSYDPASDSWTLGQPMPTRRTVAGAAAVGGSIHVIGGGVGCGPATGANEVYTPATDSWRTDAPLSLPRMGAGVVSQGGKVYVIGGYNGGQPLDRVDEFDLATQQWTAKAPMPTARGFAGTALMDGKVFVIAGCCIPGGTGVAVEVYDIATNTWSRRADLPFPLHWANASVVGGTLYVIGAGHDYRATKRYDAAADSWTDEAPIPEGLLLASTIAVGRTLYVIGGEVNGRLTGGTWAFTPAGNVAPTAAAGADQRLECVAGTATASLDGSASFDSDGTIAAYSWSRLGATFATTATTRATLPLGSHTIGLEVTDDEGAVNAASLNVDVVDTQAPKVTIASTSNSLWPANHAMVHVANVTASDACDAHPAITVTVTSRESANGRGDGHTVTDWEVRPTAGGSAVYVRAERSGNGDGRVYTVNAPATDASGNAASAQATYGVLHSAKR